jgi:alpha-D-ribose 1-methylphosphonate 5-triphosphate synthase subunit PhnI
MKGEYMRGSMQRPEISEMVMEQLRTPKLRETIEEIKEKLPEWTRDAELVPGMNEGGLMSLGGMEMDLRGGGFVPLGAQEKADDVPARLSKNEFVFTADAVRAAGDGNVDKGADKMYKTMKQLESRVG